MATISVRKRGKGWEYRIDTATISGKRQQHSRSGFLTKKEAEKAGVDALAQYQRGGLLVNPSSLSFADYLDYWMQNYCMVNLKDTTCAGYEKRIRNYIKPALGQYPLQSITPMQLQMLINQMFDEGFSRNTLSSIKGILSSALRYAIVPSGFISSNPMAMITLPQIRAEAKKPTRRKERQVLTPEQWDALIQRFPFGHSCHVPLLLGYHLGLRLGEAFGLMWEDVDFERHTLTINRQAQWNQKAQCWELKQPKYNSVRTISVDSSLLAILRQEQDQQRRGKAYFAESYRQLRVNERGQLGGEGSPVWMITTRGDGTYIQPRTTQHLNHVAHTELGLPLFDFHTLRHTHATMLLESNANPIDIQERLGHAKLKTTYRYTHNTQASRQRTADILENLFADPPRVRQK